MDFIKQTLVSNNIDINDIEEFAEIFELLGNQQEEKKVFTVISKYLKETKSGHSIWRFNRNKKIELQWFKGKREEKVFFENKQSVLNRLAKTKKPIFDQDKNGFYSIIPIVSREQVKGFLCFHDKIGESDWKKVYLATTMLTFIFQYYEMIEKMKELSVIDVVTGLYNSRHFFLQIGLEVDKAARFKQDLTLVGVKIKDLDILNQKLGFDGKDAVYQQFAEKFQQLSRKTDMPSIINDEIFAILLYETDKKGAQLFIRRLKNYFNEIKVDVEGNKFNLELETNIVEFESKLTAEDFFNKLKQF